MVKFRNSRFSINDKTLQRRLIALVDDGRIARQGTRKASRYHILQTSIETDKRHLKGNSANIFSLKSQERLGFLDTTLYSREKVTNNRDLLDSYVPDKSQYVPEKVREAWIIRMF